MAPVASRRQSGIMARPADPRADPDLRDGFGTTALHEAASMGTLASVKLLVEAGARIDASRSGYTQIDIHHADPTTPLAEAWWMSICV